MGTREGTREGGVKGALRSDFIPIFYLLIAIYRMKK